MLNAPWVRPEQAAGAKAFQQFLAGKITPELAARSGFRPADLDAKPVAPITAANGADPAQPKRVLGLPEPRVLAAIKKSWREDRKPANILLVLDTSGSMFEEQRLTRAKAGLRTFLDGIGPQDRVGLTAFNDEIHPIQPVGPMDAAGKTRLEGVIKNLVAEGGTSIYDATLQAFDTVRPLADRDHITAVVLLTDGEDTDSAASVDEAVQRLKGQGDTAEQGARVHDRLQRGRDGRARAARQDRRGSRRPELRGPHVRHRVGLPLDQFILLGDATPPLQPR